MRMGGNDGASWGAGATIVAVGFSRLEGSVEVIWEMGTFVILSYVCKVMYKSLCICNIVFLKLTL